MPVTRKPLLACMAALLALGSASVAAKDDAAKHIIADLQRIVAPDGVQESFKEIGRAHV